MLISVISIVILFFLLAILIGSRLSAPGYSGKESDHFDGKVFRNRSGLESKGFKDLVAWSTSREQGEWNDYSNLKVPGEIDKNANRRITFINHSTFLIQTEKLNILTDPVWSLRVSPFQWAGPKRMATAGVAFEDLPKIDLIILSHNHYDHLDISTVKRLKEEHDPVFIVPLGVAAYLNQNGINETIELDWDQNHELKGIKVTSVEAQHFSGRGLYDRNKTLWAGYVIEADNKYGIVLFF